MAATRSGCGPDLFCIGRSLRTNRAGAAQLASLVGGRVEIFDVAYDAGPDECLHLLSVISPVADDLAVVYLPLLPAGLYELLDGAGHPAHPRPRRRVPDPGLQRAGGAAGRGASSRRATAPRARLLAEAGCEVHAYAAQEIGVNGSGGPTCLTRPILRG